MNFKTSLFFGFGLLLLGACGQPCGPNQQMSRTLRATNDGKVYEENICVDKPASLPKYDPVADLKRN